MSAPDRWERIPAGQAEAMKADDTLHGGPPFERVVWQWYPTDDTQRLEDPRNGDIEEFRRLGSPVCRLRRVRRYGAWDYERMVWP